MSLSDEDKEKLKNDSLEILSKLKEEIDKRIAKGELSSKKVSLTVLLTQFERMMVMLKQVAPKVNLLVPIDFDAKRQRRVENLYEASLLDGSKPT